MTSLSDLARKAGFDVATNGRGVQIVVDSDGIEITDQLERLLALHVQELCAGVEPVALPGELGNALELMVSMWRRVCSGHGWGPEHLMEYGHALEALRSKK